MKKIFALLILFCLSATAAFAEGTSVIPTKQNVSVQDIIGVVEQENIQQEAPQPEQSKHLLTEVNVIIYLNRNYQYTNSDYALFTLNDGTNVYQRAVPVSANRGALGMTFDVAPYEVGKTFTLTFQYGIEKAIYYDKAYSVEEPMTLYTYSYTDALGNPQISNTTYMEYIPTQSDALFTYFNGENVSDKVPAKFIDGTIMVPIEQTARMMGIETVRYDYNYNSYVVANSEIEILFNIDNICTTISGVDINIPAAPRFIESIAYCPLSTLAGCFGAEVTIDQNDAGSVINIMYGEQKASAQNTESAAYSSYVNDAGLESDTDYLIWVSKKDFTVKVYLGKKGEWQEINSFICAIGAPESETIEGTFKYYEYIEKWDYVSYYVGPVMRFKNGYALHSTLLYNNGSSKNDTVGEKISHGCVRLRPDDINWLAYYVPLGTTIHITG